MKYRFRLPAIVSAIIVAFATAMILPSCGTMHSYWGVENDYYYQDGPHHHHKPPKYKKYKKPKKHKHHHHHHHDHDHDD